METTTNKLKMQLKSAQSELEQTRNTLKSMEGSDGHGMLFPFSVLGSFAFDLLK